MSTVHVGLAPLTLARTVRTTVYVYKGQPAPTDLVDGELDRLVDEGFLIGIEVPDPEPEVAVGIGGEPVPVVPVTSDGEKPLDEMDVDELRRYAEDRGIDTGKASTTDGLLAKIRG